MHSLHSFDTYIDWVDKEKMAGSKSSWLRWEEWLQLTTVVTREFEKVEHEYSEVLLWL
jgi:hypothetical protein